MNKFICFLALLFLLIACNLTKIPASAQFTATPTSPVLCFPITPVQPGESWYCIDGTAVVGTPTPLPTIPITPATPAPTTTPVPYPAPQTPQSVIEPIDPSLPEPPPLCYPSFAIPDNPDPYFYGGFRGIPKICQITLVLENHTVLVFNEDTFGDYTVTGFGGHDWYIDRDCQDCARMSNIYIYFYWEYFIPLIAR